MEKVNYNKDGTISYNDYVKELSNFYKLVSENVFENETYILKTLNNDIGSLVLIKKQIIELPLKKNEDNEFEQIVEIDEKRINLHQNNILSMEYHIVYHINYSVPVLYFKGCFSNGQPLVLDNIWEYIPKFINSDYDIEKLITMITQFEHPILGKPYFAIHPCKTSEMMKNLIKSFSDQTNFNYILAWISSVGPISGLKLNIKNI